MWCLVRWKASLKCFPHVLQRWGFSPVWTRSCLRRVSRRANPLPQTLHRYGRGMLLDSLGALGVYCLRLGGALGSLGFLGFRGRFGLAAGFCGSIIPLLLVVVHITTHTILVPCSSIGLIHPRCG